MHKAGRRLDELGRSVRFTFITCRGTVPLKMCRPDPARIGSSMILMDIGTQAHLTFGENSGTGCRMGLARRSLPCPGCLNVPSKLCCRLDLNWVS